ncbi:Imidazole glycerol phosphate synthase subunit HisH [Buchnera aphidicola (Thelaxes suberi)]|uniref:imidazole glycerol phosphate synthase subunit HisH n=1 Tax=Buchnera aphidicola TaxID=9 RepID=UPI00346457F5
MTIIIIDTGCSNLSSLKWSLYRLGYTSKITTNEDDIINAKKIFIPGVGSAKTAMNQLKRYHLHKVIPLCKQPVLGICLGMQLLSEFSLEGGRINCLKIIDCHVQPFIKKSNVIPHMGWNNITVMKNKFIFRNINMHDQFYFVHSYIIPLVKYTIASTDYSEQFSSVICFKNFYGVQFHPEKSGFVGETLLKNFLEME